MKAFLVSDVRPFMRALLSDTLFNGWQFRLAEISVISHISIDGKINTEYLSEEERQQRTAPYLLWEEIQPRIRSLIQGGSTPTQMNIVLTMDPAKFRGMPEGAVDSLALNIRYETVKAETDKESPRPQAPDSSRMLTLVTGVSAKTFTMDKTPEHMWDDAIPAFFKAHGILITEI